MTMVIAQSETMRHALELLEMAAPLKSPILLIGESGVGRQTLGRLVHEKSPKSRGPFVAVNLAAIPESDILASLFGHIPSLSTIPRVGLATAARGGTLLLQKIEDTPFVAQGVLLEMIQMGEVEPVGAAEAVSFDARVVATSTPILEDYVTQSRFRTDLFYRLNVIPIQIPPLRERREDILPLARHFIDLASPSGTKDLSVSAMNLLLEYSWPGNVQQLKNAVKSCDLRCIRADDIYGVSGIMQSIWEAINSSRVIIAEMTDRNPNVFYELGIAHTLGKPVIMITQSIDDVPFDLKHLRCIEYEYKPHAIKSFTDALIKTLNNVLRTPAAGRML